MESHPKFNPILQIISIFLFVLIVVKINSNTEVFNLKMESICSNAEDHINLFFNGYMEINERAKNYCPNEPLTEKDKEILKMLFFDEEAKNSYSKKKFRFLEIFYIILLIL